jgi:hypothetical protein
VLVYEKGSIEVGSLLEVNEPQKITMGTSLKA